MNHDRHRNKLTDEVVTRESDCHTFNTAQRLQRVPCFSPEHLLQEIVAVAGQQRLQKLRSLFHRRSFGCSNHFKNHNIPQLKVTLASGNSNHFPRSTSDGKTPLLLPSSDSGSQRAPSCCALATAISTAIEYRSWASYGNIKWLNINFQPAHWQNEWEERWIIQKIKKFITNEIFVDYYSNEASLKKKHERAESIIPIASCKEIINWS